MRHRVKIKKLSRGKSHRLALLRNLVRSLILKKSIITTTAKAKEAGRFAERLITYAKKNDANSHRRVFDTIGNKKVVKTFFSEIVPELGGQSGGNLRLIKTGKRKGDGADMCLIEFILKTKKEEKKEKAKRKRPRLGRRKAAPKKEEKAIKPKKKTKKKTVESKKEKVIGKKVTKKTDKKEDSLKSTRKK